MFYTRFKTILIITILFVMISFSMMLYANCDMMAMIARKGKFISDITSVGINYSVPNNFMQFIKDNSSSGTNDDGYGILYYTEGGDFYLDPENLGHSNTQQGDPDNQAWYQIGSGTYYTGGSADEKWELDTATTKLIDNQNTLATLVLGHARLGENGSGNHPFRLEIANSPDKTFTFIHNGTIADNNKTMLFNELTTNGWFANHYSNWWGVQGNVGSWIDSEVLFHWIMYNVNEADGDVIQGIRNSIIATINNGTYNLFDELFDNQYYQ